MKLPNIFQCSQSLFLLMTAKIFGKQDFEAERMDMVKDQIENRGIDHKATLAAMRRVPRHLFVPEHQQRKAYRDQPLPIGHGQTISQPYMVAYMTAAINPGEGMKILEIGTGSGYQAAVLSEIVDMVYTIEIVEPLGKKAAQLFEELGYDNIKAKVGDGHKGWPEYAPFDAIIVTAAPEEVPPPLIEQLAENGRMIIPVGPANEAQDLRAIQKKNGEIRERRLVPVRFVPFKRNDRR